MDIDKKALATIEKRAAPLITLATTIKITTQEEQNTAGEILTKLNKEADAFEALKQTVTKPLNTALKAARELFKPRETALEDAIQSLRKAMGAYQLAADKKAEQEAQRLAARVEKGTMKAETAVKKMGEIAAPIANIETGGGSVKFRVDKKIVIDNKKSVIEWCVTNKEFDAIDLDERHLLDLLKKGLTISGAHVEEVRTVINSR